MFDGLIFLPLIFTLTSILLTLIIGRIGFKRFAHLPAVVSFAASAIAAFAILVMTIRSAHPVFITQPVTWFAAGHVNVQFSLTIDPLSAIMLATVTFISTWIAIFSAGYMRDHHGEPDAGYVRYFAVMSLFVFSMCLLVTANDFLLLMAGWEGVGLCSYLLVGYYYSNLRPRLRPGKRF